MFINKSSLKYTFKGERVNCTAVKYPDFRSEIWTWGVIIENSDWTADSLGEVFEAADASSTSLRG